MASQLCSLPTNAGLGVRDARPHGAQSIEAVIAGRRPAEDQNVSPIYQKMRISAAIKELSRQGLYGIPLRIDMVNGKKSHNFRLAMSISWVPSKPGQNISTKS
jgi:hypothetical protein